MNKKIKKILPLALAGAIILGTIGAAFAIFTSREDAGLTVSAGTVDLGVSMSPNALTNPDEILPGDNDPSLAGEELLFEGKDHELTYKVETKGTQAVRTRHTVIISALDEEGKFVGSGHLRLYDKNGQEPQKQFLVVDAEGKEVLMDIAPEKIEENKDSIKAVKYTFFGDTMDGSGKGSQVIGTPGVDHVSQDSNSETTDREYTMDFALLKEAGNSYQDANIEFTVLVEAIQMDNTDDNVWNDVSKVSKSYSSSEATFNTVPHSSESADGTKH